MIDTTLEKQLIIEKAIRDILDVLDTTDEDQIDLVATPSRVARAFLELTEGYHQDPDKIINGAYYQTERHDIVMVRNIHFSSVCSHHLMPFVGYANIAYIPNKQLIGLSKIARIVRIYARRLQLQERLTYQIANLIQEKLDPLGVAVMVEASHACSQIRGVQDCSGKMLTKCFLGQFEDNVNLRQEFILDCCRKPN